MRIYTDGACAAGNGGWAWIDPETGVSASGAEKDTTNNRMELTAVLMALRANPDKLTLVSDSKYVVECFQKQWYKKWFRTNWKNGQIKNQDLWKALLDVYLGRSNISFEWVKGHNGCEGNEMADLLATTAIKVLLSDVGLAHGRAE